MNRYRAMTYVLVVSNIVMLVTMFIAAFWGFTYPKIVMDGYESGKSAFVAAFMCCLAGICLCGLNFQNYYFLVTYAVLHLLIMLNQLFSLLPFTWTRIPNYPLTGNVSTQVYIMLVPKIFLVTFAFALAYKLRSDEKRNELARADGFHQRLPCHIVPRTVCEQNRGQSAPLNSSSMFGTQDRNAVGYGTANDRQATAVPLSNTSQIQCPVSQSHPMRMMSNVTGPNGSLQNVQLPTVSASALHNNPQQPPPPHLPPTTQLPPPSSSANTSTNRIIQTPPIYPLHRPNVTDVSINSTNRPLILPTSNPLYHRPLTTVPSTKCPSRLIGNHSNSCGAGLNDISMIQDHDSMTRARSTMRKPNFLAILADISPKKQDSTNARKSIQWIRGYFPNLFLIANQI
ncbi:calponin [Sarcoptes scabiei]|nr:calponin [Sarcoptes scabiei]